MPGTRWDLLYHKSLFPYFSKSGYAKESPKRCKEPMYFNNIFSGNRLVCLFGHNLEGMISMGFVHHDFITACLHGPYLTWLPSLSAGLGRHTWLFPMRIEDAETRGDGAGLNHRPMAGRAEIQTHSPTFSFRQIFLWASAKCQYCSRHLGK